MLCANLGVARKGCSDEKANPPVRLQPRWSLSRQVPVAVVCEGRQNNDLGCCVYEQSEESQQFLPSSERNRAKDENKVLVGVDGFALLYGELISIRV